MKRMSYAERRAVQRQNWCDRSAIWERHRPGKGMRPGIAYRARFERRRAAGTRPLWTYHEVCDAAWQPDPWRAHPRRDRRRPGRPR